MARHTRREFLEDVGRGMLLAGLGTTLAGDLGLARVFADDADAPLSFGEMEPLVALMQETPPAQLTALLVERLKSGTDLQTLVAAGALANARTFGGEDYIGFHTFMALAPAYRMALELPADQRPLPVLKVLYRNTQRIQDFGGRSSEVLHPVQPEPLPAGAEGGQYLRAISRQGDVDKAERAFATLVQASPGEAFNHLQYEVEDEVDVHRVVLSWRAWETLDIAGRQWAHCFLRQSVRYCASTERKMMERDQQRSSVRTALPKLLDEYQLIGRTLGQETGDDAWLRELAQTIYSGSRDQAAGAVAEALRNGYATESIGEAMSLAANMLVLHDPGRLEKWANADKPAGSCHGDSVGVHASDAANAWRNIARVSSPRNVVASLIVGAYHTGGQAERLNPQPYPLSEHLEKVQATGADELLREAEAAVRASDQFRAAAAVARYGQLGHAARPVQDLLIKFATSEDGALHAEKYYQTVSSEFASMRPAFRWGQLVALARVTASEYGHKSLGYEEAKKLLKV